MEVPCRPWKVLGMYFFMHKSKWYLLVADYNSKFHYVLQMSSVTSKDVISTLEFLSFNTWYSIGNQLQQCN